MSYTVPQWRVSTLNHATPSSLVHEIHPSHAFLEVHDKPLRTRSQPELPTTVPDVGPSGEDCTWPPQQFI